MSPQPDPTCQHSPQRDLLSLPRALAALFALGAALFLGGAWAEYDSSDPTLFRALLAGGLGLILISGLYGAAHVLLVRQRQQVGDTWIPWPWRHELAAFLLTVGMAWTALAGLWLLLAAVLRDSAMIFRCCVSLGVGIGALALGVRWAPPPAPRLLPMLGKTVLFMFALAGLVWLGVLWS